jgi:tetratricopeptide (TPR) repeat protein
LPRYLAESQLRAGNPAEALTTLEPFLLRQPSGREPYELLEEILKALGREEEILARLETAAQADPKNISLQFALAERYRTSGQVEKAEQILKKLLEEQAEPQVFGALATSLFKERKFKDLFGVLGDALAKNGGLEAIRPTIESIVLDPPASREFVGTALDLQKEQPPKLTEPASKLALFVARRTNQTDQLIELERLLLASSPSPTIYRELAVDLSTAGRFEEAAKAMEDLLAKYPNERSVPILGALSFYRFRAGQNEQALETAREALKLDPDEQQSLQLVGILLSRLKKDEEAIAHYQDILKRFPTDDEMIRRAHAGLSAVYSELEQYPKAEAELEILLEKYPDDPGINNDLGYLYADQGKNLERAEIMIRKAIEDEPENSAYLDSLGWVLFKQGKPKEAVDYLEKAAKDLSVDSTIFEHLGDVYFQLKEHAKAQSSWQRAEEIAAKSNPPQRRLSEIRRKLAELRKLKPPDGGDAPSRP